MKRCKGIKLILISHHSTLISKISFIQAIIHPVLLHLHKIAFYMIIKFRIAALGAFFWMISWSVQSQTVVTVPVYPTDIDSCSVIYDASQGNKELMGLTTPIYAHTGVITNLSTGPGDWRYVIANWNVNTPKAQMKSLGNDKYLIKMTPSVRAWYNVPAGETILQMAFVFRNGDGSKVGREANGGDIFADVYPASTSVNIILPENKSLYPDLNEPIPIKATSPLANNLKLYVNNTLIKSVDGSTITDTIPADNYGKYWQKQWVKIVASNDTATKADSFSYTVITAPVIADLPPGVTDGINYIDSSTVVLSLFAPDKKNVFVIGDFNDWQIDSAHYLSETPDLKHFWIRLENLTPRKEYLFQYLVDGNLRIADPFSEKVCDPDDKYISPSTYPGLLAYPEGKTSQICSYLQTAQTPYMWKPSTFAPPAIKDLFVYELLIRDFTVQHDYPSLIDTLGYLKRLGVNAIELMPVMEFEGNISWGYNPDFMFAPDKYYGTKNGLKQFVEAAHAAGIAVIFDIVLNHQFGKSPLVRLYWDSEANRPAASSPWFNQIPKHPYNVGFDFNHQSQQTQEFCKRVLNYWITEYHIDGYRFDLSKGFTQINSYPNNVTLWGQRDPARIAVLNSYFNSMKAVKPDVLLILEHFADNSEEKELSAGGMMLWGNSNYNYSQATMGWNTGSNSDFSWISYKNRGWASPHLVGYMESHDEERQMFNNISGGNVSNPPYSCRDTSNALLRSGMAATFFVTVPGPKMLWQFEELGYDYSINYPSGTSASRLDPKPVRWDYTQQWRRRYLYNTFAALAQLKKDQPVFGTSDFTMSVNSALKRITLRDASMDVTIVGNFGVKEGNVVPGFTKTGWWYDFFTGDSLNVTSTIDAMSLAAGEYHLYSSARLQKPVFTGIGDPVAGEVGERPGLLVWPNPATEQVHIRFTTFSNGPASVQIFDMVGNLVATVYKSNAPAGTTGLLWNCRNNNGETLPAGIYLCRLRTDRHDEIRKVVLLSK